MIAWIDLETTGLEPREGSILEAAMLVTDDELRPLDAGIVVLVQPLFDTLAKMDDCVRDMHTKNGLLAELAERGGLRRYEAAEALGRYLDGHTAQADGKHSRPVMGGSSVHFDRAWIREHMPELERRFAYRNCDVSTVKELCKRWAPAVHDGRERGEIAHRAMDDVRASIDELSWYRRHFMTDGARFALGVAP